MTDGSEAGPVSAPLAPLDLDSTNPFSDFWKALTQPVRFFSYFAGRDALPRWVVTKGVLGLFIVNWLVAFVNGPVALKKLLETFGPSLNSSTEMIARKWPFLFSGDFDPGQIKTKGLFLAANLFEFFMILSPFIALTSILFVVSTTYFFLPWVGVEKSRRSFARMYVAATYVHWLILIGLVPIIGGLISFVVQPIYSTLAVKSMYSLSFWRSFVATYLLGWVLLFVTMAIGIAAFVFLLGALGVN